ncbi:MAG TPA: copper chaperone PCu(A)C [Phenylobacterium sp.]
MKLALAALAAVSIAGAAHAAPQVSAAWSRPAAQGTTGAGFMTLSNPGAKPDALVSVESPLAGQVMVHQSSMSGGMASMKMVASVPVPAGGSVTFAPGGYHLMFMDLTRPLKVGDRLPATLTFASGAKVKATFVVGLAPPVAPASKR